MSPSEFAREVSKEELSPSSRTPMPVKPPLPKSTAVRTGDPDRRYGKGRGSSQHAKSDWMEMEKQRGISITTSVMQFPYRDSLVNLLDTRGTKTSPKILTVL